jgi:hypothetical protein
MAFIIGYQWYGGLLLQSKPCLTAHAHCRLDAVIFLIGIIVANVPGTHTSAFLALPTSSPLCYRGSASYGDCLFDLDGSAYGQEERPCQELGVC